MLWLRFKGDTTISTAAKNLKLWICRILKQKWRKKSVPAPRNHDRSIRQLGEVSTSYSRQECRGFSFVGPQ
jgi:hypothetical protein